MKGFLVILFLAFVALFVGQTNAECSTACPALWAPVCGDNGTCLKQFSNSCSMDYANCDAKAKGVAGE